MSFYGDISGAIADALEAKVVGLQAKGYPPETVSHFPTTVIVPEGFAPDFDFSQVATPTLWRLITLLSSGDAPEGEAQLDNMLDVTATSSIVKALRADPTLDGVVDTSEVVSLENIGRRTLGGGRYFGFDVLLDAVGRENLARLTATALVVASNAANSWPRTGTNVWECDGVADEVQLLATLNALPAVATGGLRGGRLVLTEGDFYLDALLTIPSTIDEVIIEGCGPATRLHVTGATDGITWAGTAQTLIFRDLKLMGNSLAGHGMVVPSGGGHLTLENVHIQDFTQSGKYPLDGTNALHSLHIDDDCEFLNNASGPYLKSVQSEIAVSGRFRRNLARQLTVIGCSGEVRGFFEVVAEPTDAEVYLLDCVGLRFMPYVVDFSGSNANLNMIEVGKSTATSGCEGVMLLGGKYEYAAGYSGTGVPIHCSIGASGIIIAGQNFLCRNSANSPIKLTSDADKRVHNIRIGAIIWDTAKPPYTADSNVRRVYWDGFRPRDYIFALDNLAAGQTNTAIPLPGVTLGDYWAENRYWAVQLEVYTSAAIPTGESLTIAVRSGTAIMLSASLAAGERSKEAEQNAFAGNWGAATINCVYTSSNNGAWAATIDVTVIVHIMENQTMVAIVP